MRRAVIIAFLFLAPAIHAQTIGGGSIKVFSGVPSGSCVDPQQAKNNSTGDLYSCLSGAWHLVASGGGGGSPTGAATVGLDGTYPGPKLNHNATAFLSVITDCGAVGDGVTNDLTAINNCISSNSSKKIIFPKTQADGSCDYSIAGTITIPKANSGIILIGEGGNTQQSTKICSSTDATGLFIGTIGVKVENITFFGNSAIDFTNLSTYTVGTSDGIMVCAPGTYLENISAYNFSRHGVNFASTAANPCPGGAGASYISSDGSILINPFIVGNRADGILMQGNDSNAINIIGGRIHNNGWFGIQDRAFGNSGSAIIGPNIDANHSASGALVSAGNLTSCSVTAGVLSCIATAPETLITGDLIDIEGSTTSAYNANIFSYTPIVVDSSTTFHILTGDEGPADGTSTTGGTLSYYSGYRVWAQAGVYGGSYYGYLSAPKFINVYTEFNQPQASVNAPATINGSSASSSSFWGSSATFANNMDSISFLPTDEVVVDGENQSGTQFHGWNSATRRKSKQRFKMNGGNAGTNLDSLFNVSAGLNTYLNFYRNAPTPGVDGWWCWAGYDSSVGLLNSGTNLCMSDNSSTASGGLTWFYNGIYIGATEPTGANGVRWTSGSGVPSAGTCVAANGGSLYSRTDGNATTTLYVCDNSTHTWTAK